MKRIICSVLALLLVGCAAFNDTHFNESEYDKLIVIKWAAQKALSSCSTNEIELMSYAAMLETQLDQLVVWETFHDSKLSLKMITDIHAMAFSVDAVYSSESGKPSKEYCVLKFQTLNEVIDIALKAVSNKEQK
jgi:hypothetical protein